MLNKLIEIIEKQPTQLTNKNKRDFSLLSKAVIEGNTEQVKKVIELSSKLASMQSEDGYTPLHVAVLEGHYDIVKILLNSNPKVILTQTTYGYTPLHLAAFRGYTLMMQLLLDDDIGYSEVIYTQDNNGQTALHWAAKYHNIEAMRLLLQFDQELVTCKDYTNKKPIDYVKLNKYFEVAKLLEDTETRAIQHFTQNSDHNNTVVVDSSTSNTASADSNAKLNLLCSEEIAVSLNQLSQDQQGVDHMGDSSFNPQDVG
ncbi:MAG: ankyrin repeat domain-containing protein [Rickettsiaceae bacterium]|nr:MAG: ankyrin repeat domain-containing protein [Rickettsiaceae bacterium]